MNARVDIDAGICGFQTTAQATSEDGQNVCFAVESDCEKIRTLGAALKDKGPIDAYQEISPAAESVLMGTIRSVLTGCCAGCAVPVGLVKVMREAALGFRDAAIHIQTR